MLWVKKYIFIQYLLIGIIDNENYTSYVFFWYNSNDFNNFYKTKMNTDTKINNLNKFYKNKKLIISEF